MDTLGRRSLLLWTLPPMAVTMLAAGLSFQLPQGTLRFGLLAGLIYLFCAEYSPGTGPVPCTYSAEVYPLSHREAGMSVAIATTNLWAALLSLTFPALLARLGPTDSFALYAALNLFAACLVFFFVREAKRRTLDEMDGVFAASIRAFAKQALQEARRWLREQPHLASGAQEYRELRQDETGDPE